MSCKTTVLALLLSCASLHAADPAASKAPGPAKVSGGLKEADLAAVTLTPEAASRLGITTAPIERRSVPRTRNFAGEVIMPGPAGVESLKEGSQSILAILSSLTPTDLIRIAESQVDADGQVEQARVAHEAAKVNLGRVELLLKNKAGTERAVLDARVAVQQAEGTLRTTQARRALLAAPVLDVLNPQKLWLRVPVYVGDLERLDTAAPASVGHLAEVNGETFQSAVPVPAPPSANALAATVDLFYAMDNADRKIRLGQRMGVHIPLTGPETSLVVPWSAVVYDFQGGAWVYEQTAAHTYANHRVQVRFVTGQDAVLETGPAPGARVVNTGAAELFGTQFGTGK